MTSQTQPAALLIAGWLRKSNEEAMAWREDAATAIELLHARVQELEVGLKKANAQAEHFEREWYLRGDELEAAQAQRPPQSRDCLRPECMSHGCFGQCMRKAPST